MKTGLVKKTYQCHLKILSPLHLGCDEVYEPMRFTVDEAKRCLVVFNPAVFFAEMDKTDRNEFSKICRKGTIASILEIYKFLRRRTSSGRAVRVCSDFVGH